MKARLPWNYVVPESFKLLLQPVEHKDYIHALLYPAQFILNYLNYLTHQAWFIWLCKMFVHLKNNIGGLINWLHPTLNLLTPKLFGTSLILNVHLLLMTRYVLGTDFNISLFFKSPIEIFAMIKSIVY